MMKSFDTRTYSISDFAEWHAAGLLVLSPEFQRRAVWSTQAKSYLIDTVLRGKPMPKVLITQTLVDGKNVRTVVDGQQRLRAILEYLDGGFSVARTHNAEFAGQSFADLPQEVRDDYWQYEVGVDVLFNTELSDLLDIFARLNTYSVKLNSTELLNASYLGDFKTTSHALGHRYAQLLHESGILSSSAIARMGEVELTADLIGALMDGISSRKQIPNFYKKYDDAADRVELAASSLNTVFAVLSDIYEPSELKQTNFRRPHLFYSLILALAFHELGTPDLPGVDRAVNMTPSRVRVALDDFSAQYDDITSGRIDASDDWDQFVQNSRRATTDQPVRLARTRFIAEAISVA
ncbi:DUF262 domain-containing protein [Microbacterium oxydans]|uniref:DUF262 domain-containing protein n=1 Tax=Microbacterium oxydans TaxID=82380 RepID=UPI00366F8EDF